MKKEILFNLLKRAITILYDVDYDNIKLDVEERNVCARLAHHLENLMREYDKGKKRTLFKRYYVDVEYNRLVDLNGNIQKKSIIYPGGEKATIICDLIVHSRGKVRKQDNLLALEMKKTNNDNSVESDQERLRCLISPAPNNTQCKNMYNTLLGVFLVYDENKYCLTCYQYINEAEGYIFKTEETVHPKVK